MNTKRHGEFECFDVFIEIFHHVVLRYFVSLEAICSIIRLDTMKLIYTQLSFYAKCN